MYLLLVCAFPCGSCTCGVVLTWCGVAVSLNEDVDTNKELVAHGYSNLIAGFVGTVYVLFLNYTVEFRADFTHADLRPNYLVYVNTLL